MRSLYFDCETGISGDMIVASLLDLGADEKKLMDVLGRIKAGGFEVRISRVLKSGIDCCDFSVILDKEHDNHDHDMDYLYGHVNAHEHSHDHYHDHGHEHHHEQDHAHHHEHTHDHEHDHDHKHAHDHAHEHGHEHHHHEHRGLKEITQIIESLEMTENAKTLAVKTFTILGEAEAKAHGKSLDEVHFHEVGAVDSIVDIIAAAVCFDDLSIDEVIIPKICEGTGSVRCQHGILSVPVPAVMNISSMYHLPLSVTGRKGELITPTGAAFAAAVMTSCRLPEIIIPVKTGLGAGKRAYERPSILRAVMFEKVSADKDHIWKLETNIDDSTGEQLGFVMERLKNAGARDVFYTPVYMKKNRPAWLLSVITTEDRISLMEDIIFSDTTTIGIRRQKMERTILPRKSASVMTSYGEVELKICDHRGTQKVYPEYESLSLIALKNDVPISDIYREAVSEYLRMHKK